MERRGFFKGALGAAVAAMVPRVAKAKEMGPDGTVSLDVIANGPFVSVMDVFSPGGSHLYNLVRVKIGEKTIDFNHNGNLARDFQEAKTFMEQQGYRQWIITRSLQDALKEHGQRWLNKALK